jgi:hypothetical protein
MPKIGDKEVSPEVMMGMDVDRKWVTGAQAFVMSDFSMLIFREQIMATDTDGKEETSFIVKNVTSVVMPTQVLIELNQILNRVLKQDTANPNGG